MLALDKDALCRAPQRNLVHQESEFQSVFYKNHKMENDRLSCRKLVSNTILIILPIELVSKRKKMSEDAKISCLKKAIRASCEIPHCKQWFMRFNRG